jgi:hypothetical protein
VPATDCKNCHLFCKRPQNNRQSLQRLRQALCVLEFDMRKIVGLIPGIGFFIYLALMLDDLKASSIFGCLVMSIAIGSIGYFFLNAPEGRRKTETAFGLTGKYRNPVHGTIIPTKIVIRISALFIAVSVLGLTFHYNGY